VGLEARVEADEQRVGVQLLLHHRAELGRKRGEELHAGGGRVGGELLQRREVACEKG
jgi:hypothetical protein